MSPDNSRPEELTAYFQKREGEMLDALRRLVDMESPSEDLSAIEDFALALQLYVETETGGNSEIIRSGPLKRPHVLTRLGDRTDVLFIGHFDTVYPLGITETAPFRIDDGRAYGAGVLDMKAGLVIMTEVAKLIQRQSPNSNVTLFFNSDEEIASPDSRYVTRELAAEASLILIFEFTNDESEVKIGSRGNNPIEITIRGRGGHAAYPEQLSNPINALAEVITQLQTINKPEIGQVVVPTLLTAGSRLNVVPETVSLTVDTRYSDQSMLEAIEEKLRSIKFSDPDLSLSYVHKHEVPLHRADPNTYAFQLVKSCAAEFGIEMRGIEARGASDMNHAGPVNSNVVEAVGGCGTGAHSAEREFLYISSLVRRAALSTLITERALRDAASS